MIQEDQSTNIRRDVSPMMIRSRWIWILPALLCVLASASNAQTPPGGTRADQVTKQVKFEQRLGAVVPGDLKFDDSNGDKVSFSELTSDRPVVLIMAYYRCPMLCTLVLNGAADALRKITLEPGDDYGVIVVSIDPNETPELARKNRSAFIDRLARSGSFDAVHFLTGDKPEIDKLADTVGFKYVYDEQTEQFAHASGIMILTPERVVSKYFFGVDYSPRDVRLGLVEASEGKVGSVVDQLLLLCYQYDPTKGEYGLVIQNSLRIGGLITVILVAGTIGLLLRHEHRRRSGDVRQHQSVFNEGLN